MSPATVGIFLVNGVPAMLAICCLLGAAKGVRTVYMQLVIPAHVPIERLAAASGLQMVVNGAVIMVLGPLMGAIRDWSGTYERCVLFINAVTMVTLTMWSAEFMWQRCRRNGGVNNRSAMRRNETVASFTEQECAEVDRSKAMVLA